ncbi:MAG TPA: hypothetical protein VGH84_17010 [Steroidobacteraceae bacterium]
MATYVLTANRAGVPSVVTTATSTGTYMVPLAAIVTEAGSGGGGGGGGTANAVRVMVLA